MYVYVYIHMYMCLFGYMYVYSYLHIDMQPNFRILKLVSTPARCPGCSLVLVLQTSGRSGRMKAGVCLCVHRLVPLCKCILYTQSMDTNICTNKDMHSHIHACTVAFVPAHKTQLDTAIAIPMIPFHSGTGVASLYT